MNNIIWNWIKALTGIDAYKLFHHKAYRKGIEKVYVNLTARSGTHSNVKNSEGVTFLGMEGYKKEYLEGHWQDFFNTPWSKIEGYLSPLYSGILGEDYNLDHIKELHELGYMPIEIKTLQEGNGVPYGVPMLTVENTDKRFFWLPNFLETQMSAYFWPIITSATTAAHYYRNFEKAAEKSGMSKELIPYLGHDFSSRGLMGHDANKLSGLGHLSFFKGSDNVPAIAFAKEVYKTVGVSVSATEHSVMCSWGKENELETFRHLINKAQPQGIVSIVSDTWDLWKVVNEFLPTLKEDILARDGKVVIRPDSGDPVHIICGNPDAKTEHERKGLVECLWDIFGGTTNSKGYKELDSHIGAIYGDSITLERQEQILNGLIDKGFVPNVVLGIGSYTYQYVTRDTHGMAFKATNITVNGKDIPIFKDPKTDDGTKKSAKGRLAVVEKDGVLTLIEGVENKEIEGNLLTTVYKNGNS